jgi:hypothetical protein
MLVAFAMVAACLGWNANIVRQRRALLAEEQWILVRGIEPQPWVRRLMGDEPVQLLLWLRQPSTEELDRAERLFPEARVSSAIFRYPGRDD